MIAEEAAAIERRLVHLRDLIEGGERELTRGMWKGLGQNVWDELEKKIEQWREERGELTDRRHELEELPIDLTPTPAAERRCAS